MRNLLRAMLVLVSAIASLSCEAVRVDPTGMGQALIYPYYTSRTMDNTNWNTLFSVVNTRAKGKVLKVRYRDALQGAILTEINVYLGPYDVWTTVIFVDPATGKSGIITTDISCTDPAAYPYPFPANAIPNGNGLEGYLEIIEMATLAGTTATAATSPLQFSFAGCAPLVGAGKTRTLEAPEGGLYGSAMLINVDSGLSSTYAPVALADLTQQAFYSDVGQPGTDFDSPQVTPLSIVTLPGSSSFGNSSDGYLLRSVWSRGVDAVSAVLMTSTITNEYVLDPGTNSNTDWIVTFPMARFSAAGACPSYSLAIYNRDQVGPSGVQFPVPPPLPTLCGSTNVISWANAPAVTTGVPSRLFGSTAVGAITSTPQNFQDGFATITLAPSGSGLTSLPSSTAIDLSTGDVITGAHKFAGLPAVGFGAWSFNNGLLDCNGKTCKGSYGINFAHAMVQSVTRVAP